jgi:hypothetical protein
MMRFRHVVVSGVTLAMVALAGSLTVAHAQEGRGTPAPPPEPKNLQVFPKTMTTAQLLPIMRNFAAALGTNCGYCHQWTGPGAPGNDFSVDTKPQKDIARAMMRMANAANESIAAATKKPADQQTRVQCMTCHRGEAIPKTPTAAPAGERGAPPAGGGRQ